AALPPHERLLARGERPAELAEETRLAEPGRADERHEPRRRRDHAEQELELELAPDERRGPRPAGIGATRHGPPRPNRPPPPPRPHARAELRRRPSPRRR